MVDYIAHLATIDIWVGEWFEAMAGGARFIPRANDGSPFDIDKWNDDRINERHESGLDALLDEAARTRAVLMSTFPRFSEETLASRFNFRGRDISFLEYLEAWTLHDPAHSIDMLKAMPEKRTDPVLQSWLAKFPSQAMHEVADVNANATAI